MAPSSWLATEGTEVCVCGVGARTPLGLNWVATAAAVRAGISARAEHPIFVDKAGEPIGVTRDAVLSPDVPLSERLTALLTSAVNDARLASFDALRHERVQCVVALPEERPGIPASIATIVSSAMAESVGVLPSSIRTIQQGHSGGLMAIQSAARAISSGAVDVCVIAGVDSYHDADTLEWLDHTGRLMSSENRNGFPPGEAAGACVLVSHTVAHKAAIPVLAWIPAAAIGVEPHPIRSGGVCVGEGLTAVLRAVAPAASPRDRLTTSYCDLNGERYRNEEFTYALLRVQHGFVDAHDYESPADCWGDVGAASGPLFASLAIAASQRGYSRGSLPVLWAGSENGTRSAVVLRTLERERS